MSYENIKIEKGLYTTGKSFTQALEALDPSENYKGTSLEGLDAFERLRDLILRFQARTAILFQSFSKLLIQQHFSLNLFPVQSSLV